MTLPISTRTPIFLPDSQASLAMESDFWLILYRTFTRARQGGMGSEGL